MFSKLFTVAVLAFFTLTIYASAALAASTQSVVVVYTDMANDNPLYGQAGNGNNPLFDQ